MFSVIYIPSYVTGDEAAHSRPGHVMAHDSTVEFSSGATPHTIYTARIDLFKFRLIRLHVPVIAIVFATRNLCTDHTVMIRFRCCSFPFFIQKP